MPKLTFHVKDESKKKMLSEKIYRLIYDSEEDSRKIVKALEDNKGMNIDDIRKILRSKGLPRKKQTLINYCKRCGIPYFD